MADFRHRTIAPMLAATSSMRWTIEQSLRTIEATRAALEKANQLASATDEAIADWHKREDIT